MANVALASAKMLISLKEKRRFNWVVLALLILTIGLGATSQLQLI